MSLLWLCKTFEKDAENREPLPVGSVYGAYDIQRKGFQMKLLNKCLTTAAFAVALAATPVMASPVSHSSAISSVGLSAIAVAEGNVIQIKTSRERRAERRAKRSRHRGYRGYHKRRRGYRRHSDGIWYPLAAFGALAGAAIANSQSSSSRHVEWCDNRYRSYRRYDNTFQPYNGPRRQCNSPFD